MNIQRILCPVDFSEYNLAANQYASSLAKSTGARIIYLHAYVADPYETPPIYFDSVKTEKELVDKLENFIEPDCPDVQGSYVVEYGLATDRIIKYANENEVDLIVMGTHGRTGLRRVLLGSVVEAVIRQAECPVLAIKSETKVPLVPGGN